MNTGTHPRSRAPRARTPDSRRTIVKKDILEIARKIAEARKKLYGAVRQQ